MDTPSTTPETPSDAEQPQKYARTFEGDMETLKKGGIPDLAPFRGTPSVGVEQPASSLRQAMATDGEVSFVAPTPPPIVTAPEAPRSAPLKTYESDFSNLMKESHASTATVLAAEQDSAPRTPQALSEKSSRNNLIYGIAGGILLVAGGIGAYVAYVKYLSVSAPVVVAPAARAPIFVDDREEISGSGGVLLQALEKLVSRPLSSGAVRLVYFAGATATTTSVFSALPLSAPGVLLRSIVAASSMAGVVNAGGNQSPFFILSVTSFSNTFAGMLAWEPVMPRDLAKLFPPYPAPPAAATSTVATTTSKKSAVKASATTLPVLAPVPAFHDEVIANHDVRAYRDAAGRVVLLYGYWNQTTLVIARNPAAFTEILGRLATSRAQL